AVGAAELAAVGHRDPQVAQRPCQRVSQRQVSDSHHRTSAPGNPAPAGLGLWSLSTFGVPGGMPELLLPPPSRLAAGGLAARKLSLQPCDLRAQVLNLGPPCATAGLAAAITAAGLVTSGHSQLCLACGPATGSMRDQW